MAGTTAGPARRRTSRLAEPASPAQPARRRRYLTVTITGTVLAAATAVSLLLATSGAPQPPTVPRGGTPIAMRGPQGPRRLDLGLLRR